MKPKPSEVVGYRAKVGMVIPSTNTVVEADCYTTRLDGVTFHAGRIYNPMRPTNDDHSFQAMITHMEERIGDAVRDVMTCEPDHLIIGADIASFYGGVTGSAEFRSRLAALCGVGISTGADACRAALEAYGVKRVGVITAYQPWSEHQALECFGSAGFEVVRSKGFPIQNPRTGAIISEDALLAGLKELDGPDIEAIVQVGTNLSMVRLADEAERWLGKPVIAINAALIWHALRHLGIRDQFLGFGNLLRHH